MFTQRLRLAHPIDPNDDPEVTGVACFDTGKSVLEHRRLGGLNAKRPRGSQKGVGRGLALQPLAIDHVPVDDLLEQVEDARRHEHVPAIGARRHDRPAQAGVTGGMDVANRALVGLDALIVNQTQDEVVLAIPQAIDRVRPRGICGSPLGQVNPPRLEERTHPVVAWLAVHVAVVVRDLVEGDKMLAGLLGAPFQELVEHLLPGRRVDGGGLGQHAVHVEQAGLHVIGQPEHVADGTVSPVSQIDRVEVIIIGAGLAGLVATLELLENPQGPSSLLLVDRCHPQEVGGLAREAFGGMFMVDSPEQRRSGIRDSVELALDDWSRVAGFEPEDVWPRRWAEEYVARARDEVGGWLKRYGVRFFPVVNWAERGVYGDGNSVPRFHLTWGCGQALVDSVWGAIERHPRRSRLKVRFRSRVTALETEGGRVTGCQIQPEDGGGDSTEQISADHVVIAAGGVGGNLEIVRREWPADLGPPPPEILMGSHYYADGAMHEEAKRVGANITHISRMWNYADAVRHPNPRRPLHGVKLIPPRSGLVLAPTGHRYGPIPLMPTFDAHYALRRMCEDPRGYYWMVCNWKIARRELDVSGSEHNPQIRDKHLVRFLLSVVLGKPTLVQHFVDHCPDFLAANSLEELGQRMREMAGDGALDVGHMLREVRRYDATVARGKGLFNDDQLRRIESVANWRGDRLRTSRFQRIEDPKAGPLIAIRMTVLARKSLGGIQTDLGSRALDCHGDPIPGLYAAGEAAGFGGGGMHGHRSLEGTFLGGCVFSGRIAAASIAAAQATGTKLEGAARPA